MDIQINGDIGSYPVHGQSRIGDTALQFIISALLRVVFGIYVSVIAARCVHDDDVAGRKSGLPGKHYAYFGTAVHVGIVCQLQHFSRAVSGYGTAAGNTYGYIFFVDGENFNVVVYFGRPDIDLVVAFDGVEGHGMRGHPEADVFVNRSGIADGRDAVELIPDRFHVQSESGIAAVDDVTYGVCRLFGADIQNGGVIFYAYYPGGEAEGYRPERRSHREDYLRISRQRLGRILISRQLLRQQFRLSPRAVVNGINIIDVLHRSVDGSRVAVFLRE